MEALWKEGVKVLCLRSAAMHEASRIYPSSRCCSCAEDQMDCLDGCRRPGGDHEWTQFRSPDFDAIKKRL